MSETEAEVKKKFQELAKANGVCPAFKVFNIGAHGTVYVGCGIPAGHEDPPPGGAPILFHQTQQGEPEGDLIVFRWPV